jgi:peptide/nickel transport system substrate-binding protein
VSPSKMAAPWSPDRRSLLKVAVVAGAGIGLAGCGDSTSQSSPSAGATGAPRRGGRLRIGAAGSGNQESFSPYKSGGDAVSDYRVDSVYDGLIIRGDQSQAVPWLATAFEPSADASTWRFTLRDGVTFHDGSPLTPADVIYSLRRSADPKISSGAGELSAVLARQIKADGRNAVIVPLSGSDITFPTSLGSGATVIVKEGTTTFNHPIGTGPFKFASFTPGQQSLVSRNPDYWGSGPYVDEQEVLSISDDSARLNALLSGDLDIMDNLPPVLAKQHSGSNGFVLQNVATPFGNTFEMRVDQPPFNDNRVRQAMRLLVDRQAMVDVALDGYGSVANDLYGKGLPYFADSIPARARDVEKAKALLSAAGQSNLTLTLETSTAVPGGVAAATLFAQQAKDGGVTINVKQDDPSAFYDSSLTYMKRKFTADWWTVPSLKSYYDQVLVTGAPYNETHQTNKEFDGLVSAAVSAATDTDAHTAWMAVQQWDYDNGGTIVWSNIHSLAGLSAKVQGVRQSPWWQKWLKDAWLSA